MTWPSAPSKYLLAATGLLIAVFLLPNAPAQAGIDVSTEACTEIASPSYSEDFQFTPSSELKKFALSIPPGSVIGTIRIRRLNVFDPEDSAENSWFYTTANSLHSLTREFVIRDQLLVSEGDSYNHSRIKESERIIRELKFIYDARVRPWRLCGNTVDLEVITRDVWTFTPTVSFSRSGGTNSYTLGVRDTNVLGSGKQIAIAAERDEERSGTTFIYKDPAVFGSRWRLKLGVTDNDDGYDRSLFVARPFFSIYETWSAGTFLREYELEEKIWFRGDEVAEFEHQSEQYRVFGGIGRTLKEDRKVGRWLFGYHFETNDFDYSDSTIPPPTLPATRDYSYPFIGYQSLEDKYHELKNVNYLGRTEDFNVGEHYQWTLGYSDENLGATRDQVVLNARYGNTLLSGGDHLWTVNTFLAGFWNTQQEDFENLRWTGSTRYHYKQSDKWALFGRLRVDYTDGLPADKQLTRGGSNGLRGYDRNYQTGDRAFVLNLEQRYYSDWHPFRLLRVGAAAFFDVGRAWFNNRDNGSNGDVLANVGLGLRFNSSRAQRGGLVHVDLAFPLVKDDDVDDVQFLVTVKQTF